MKKIMLVVVGIALISCQKLVDVKPINSSSFDKLVSTDSIVFSEKVGPGNQYQFDTQYHKLLLDSFYTNVPFTIRRATFTVADAGSITKGVRMSIDNVLLDSLFRESRYQYYTRYFDFVRVKDTIKAGHHKLRFWGVSYPLMDSLNVYYCVFTNDFECYNLQGDLVNVYGLPIVRKKKHIEAIGNLGDEQ